MMLGDKVSAQQAEDLGMIYQCIVADEFEQTAVKLAEKLSLMPTQALAYTKELLNQSMNNDLDAQLDMESRLQIASAQSEDYAEGVAAFIEKRKPNFVGK